MNITPVLRQKQNRGDFQYDPKNGISLRFSYGRNHIRMPGNAVERVHALEHGCSRRNLPASHSSAQSQAFEVEFFHPMCGFQPCYHCCGIFGGDCCEYFSRTGCLGLFVSSRKYSRADLSVLYASLAGHQCSGVPFVLYCERIFHNARRTGRKGDRPRIKIGRHART